MASGRDYSGKLQQIGYLSRFSCLGADCEDTCCHGWGMQVDEATKKLYSEEAPELLNALSKGEADIIMKRDAETDFCVKFDAGICSIHKERGSKFLGDACHFYPRITRTLGGQNFMTAALSCPEVVRQAITQGSTEDFHYTEVDADRVPESLKSYGSDALEAAHAQAALSAQIAYIDREDVTAEHAVAALFNMAQSIELQDEKNWHEAIPLYLKIAEGRMPAPEAVDADMYRLVNILVALMHAAKKTNRPRLEETVAKMETVLEVTIDKTTMQILSKTGELKAHKVLEETWKKAAAAAMQPVLKRYVMAQVMMASFPFAGLGGTPKERAVLLAVRFATVKLALMAHMDDAGNPPDEATIVRVIQSISRFLDHLADPEFSMMAYEEAGWLNEARLRGLVGDVV